MKNKYKSNNKWLIIMGIALIIIAVAIGIILLVTGEDEDIVKGPEKEPVYVPSDSTKLEGRVATYIDELGENYYIKYVGKFKDNTSNLIDAVVEYTKDKQNYGFRSSDLSMHLIYDGAKLYTISHSYKLIIDILPKSVDMSEYNLLSNIGQVFVKSYNEKVGSSKYEVEEYVHDDVAIKYYFLEGNIKIIRYGDREIRVIRLEKNSNKEILTKPSGYSYTIV